MATKLAMVIVVKIIIGPIIEIKFVAIILITIIIIMVEVINGKFIVETLIITIELELIQ